jgi:YidC/Oxa1 family membrane protein insertase
LGDFFLNIILFIYNTLAFQNLGVAIVEIAVLTRVVFWPFTKQQARYGKKMAELAPHIKALKEKHKDNQQALAQAQMALFKQHGVNPAGGCLGPIVQIAVLIGLFGALNQILTMNLNTRLLVWDMAKPDVFNLSGIPFSLPGILVILASLTQYIQSRMMFPAAPAVRREDKPAEKEEKKEFMEEFAEAQSSMIWMFSLMFLFLGTQWPSGLALYWTVSSIPAIWQQYHVAGLGGLKQDIVKLRRLVAGSM